MSRRKPETKPPQPSIVALLFCIWALAVPLVFHGRVLNGDGDLPRHLVLGRYVPGHGVTFPDVFSHTRPGHTFIAYEWLSEVVLAGMERLGGLVGIVVLAALLIATSLALTVRYLRPRVEPAVAMPAGFLIAIFTGPHWLARPHLFTFLGLPLLLLLATRPPDAWRPVGLAVLLALWANLHPGFLYGLVVLGAYLVGDAVDERDARRLRNNAISWVAAAAATLLNPLGWRLHLEILRHLADSRAFVLVQEFSPPSVTSAYGLLFFGVIMGVAVLLVARRRMPPFAVLLPLVAAVVAGIASRRNIPLFALFALPLTLGVAAEPLRRWHWAPLERPRRVMREDDARGTTTPWVAGVVGVLALLVALSGRVGPVRLIPDEFSPDVFPVTAVARAREAGLDERTIFNEYTWGGYVLWAWPGQRIYVDGMANFFGSSLMDEYVSVMTTRDGWQEILRRRGIDLLLVSPTSLLARRAEASGAWNVWYRDSTAVVLLQQDLSNARDTVVLRPVAGPRLSGSSGRVSK